MAVKKGFFQKADQKKQYSENVLNNVESAYRPKKKVRAKNPISSNTMSGEEPDSLEENVEPQQQSGQPGSFRNPVAYAFAGPQAKRKKLEAQVEADASAKIASQGESQGEVSAAVVFAAPSGFAQNAEPVPEPKEVSKKRRTQVGVTKKSQKQSPKLSRPEILIRTGIIVNELLEPEIRVTTGVLPAHANAAELELPQPLKIEPELAAEREQGTDVLEAMKALEADVQVSKGKYAPIEENEIQVARAMGFQSLFSCNPAKNEMQYELEFDSISADQFDQSEVIQQIQSVSRKKTIEVEDTICELVAQAELLEESLIDQASSAELGLSFEPQNYRKDTRKTQFLTLPQQGIRRSNRGTIEAVFQPNGKVVEAQYNRCGILIEVCVAGAMKLTRSAETGRWTMSCSDGGQPVNGISSVAFDRLGNLCYATEDGRTTVICADGRVVEK